MVYAQLRGAVLLVKTLDRISRDLLEKSEVAFKIVDMPNAEGFKTKKGGPFHAATVQRIAEGPKKA